MPILIALSLSAMILLFSMSENLVGLYGGSGITKSLLVKAGGRANSSGLGLVQNLLFNRVIDRVVGDPTAGGATTWKIVGGGSPLYNISLTGPSGFPKVVVNGCNPRLYGGYVPIELYGLGTLPDPTNCSNANADLTPNIDFTSLSGNGVWDRNGNNYVSVASKSQVPLGQAAAVGLPVVNTAQVALRAPIPSCNLTLSATTLYAGQQSIVTGQTATLTLTSSENTDNAAFMKTPTLPPIASDPYWVPITMALDKYGKSNLAIQQTGSIKIVPQTAAAEKNPNVLTYNGPGAYTYIAEVTGPVDPTSGVAGSATCSIQLIVYATPSCTAWATPSSISAGQPTTLTMVTSNTYGGIAFSPITAATLDGTGLPSITINGGTKVVYPPQGFTTYTGWVTGINGYPPQSCPVTVTTYAYPVCSVGTWPTVINSGDPAWVYMYTNWSNWGNTSGNPLSAYVYGPWLPATYVDPRAKPAVVGPIYPQNWSRVNVNYDYYGVVNGVNAAANTCKTTLTVKPVCPYKNPWYVGWEFVPGYGWYPFGRRLNTSGRYGCSSWYDPDYGSYPSPWPGIQSSDFGNSDPNPTAVISGHNPSCTIPGMDCVGASFLYACATPVSYTIINLNDPNCVPVVYAERPVGGGCFSRETRLTLADGTQKRADEIRQNDRLYNPVLGTAARIRKITRGPEPIPLYEIGYDGKTIHVTEGHPIPTEQGLKEAREITLADSMLGPDRQYHRITLARRLPLRKGERVWNFELDAPSTLPQAHYLIADGLVTGDLFLQNDLKKRRKASLP